MLPYVVNDIVALQETRKEAVTGEKIGDELEEKTVEQEHLAYANKLVCRKLTIIQYNNFVFLVITIILMFTVLQYFRRLKMPSKHFWSLQMLGLTGLGIRYC